MKKLLDILLAIALLCSAVEAAEAKKKKREIPGYTLTPISAPMLGPVDINNKGEVLIERQLIPSFPAVPVVVRNNKETPAFQCPGTEHDTDAEGINNGGEIVGHCGHDARAPGLFAFVANPRTGAHTLLSVPGSTTTWGYGINDFGDVVGLYENPIEPPFCCFLPPRHIHSFLWLKASGEYITIDNPLGATAGGHTWLKGINNKRQIIGHYTTINRVPWEEFQFIYENGIFTPIVYPNSFQTHVVAINNDTQILGWYTGAGCQQSMCLFLRDDGLYFAIDLPLPPNAPRPDAIPAGNARLIRLSGLNDKGQFVGSYVRILEWNARDHLGNIAPSKSEVINFIATPGR